MSCTLIGRFHAATKRLPHFRNFATDLRRYYRIEVSNAERPDATRLKVRGPDIDGMMASMTVALARKGCSLLELHAGKAIDSAIHETNHEENEVEDLFFVVKHDTGEKFFDEELEDLGKSLLDSLKEPMKILSGSASLSDIEDDYFRPLGSEEKQITVIKGKDIPI